MMRPCFSLLDGSDLREESRMLESTMFMLVFRMDGSTRVLSVVSVDADGGLSMVDDVDLQMKSRRTDYEKRPLNQATIEL